MLNRRSFLGLIATGAGTLGLAACSPAASSSTGNASASSGTSNVVATFLKVGKADAIVIQQANTCVMVDTGTADSASDVLKALEDLGVSSLNALIVTHFDQDHVGGAAAVIEKYRPEALYVTYPFKESDEVDAYEAAVAAASITPQQVSGTQSLSIGGVSYDLIAPDKSSYANDTSNNSSLVTRVSFGSTSMLLAGDVQAERIDELLTNGTNLSCDLLKVPHHGRIEDNTDAFVTACAPAYAVITSSKGDKEDSEVKDILEAAGAEVFLTRKGAVTCVSDGSKLSVTQ